MLRRLVTAIYMGMALGANAALAGPVTEVMLAGDMKKLNFGDPAEIPAAELLDAADATQSLAEWRGQWVVLNFWATWCAPCRTEMPSLDRLQAAMPAIAVLPVATGRNSVTAIEKFYAEAGVANLPVLRDPKSELSRAMGVLGLPVTVIVNPEGQEVARLIGDAEWDSAEAQAVLAALASGR